MFEENERGRGSESGRSAGGQKSSMGERGNPEKASPAAVERYLKGTHFPAEKETLVEKAKENNAPSDVMNVMNRLADKEYNSPVDVAKEVGRIS